MKRILTIIAMMACAAVLMNSCQTSSLEVKEGVPLTIQASVTPPAGTKTFYEYTDDKTLEGFWKSEESITVVSFGENGITAIDTFTSVGERGRKKAKFSGTWNGREGDKVICLYPAVDTDAGKEIFDGVWKGSPTIYMRELSLDYIAVQHDDIDYVSAVDLMLGEVSISGDFAQVYLEHQFAVFRIEVTLKNFPYDAPGSPYKQAKINSIRIKCVDPDSEVDDWGPYRDPVFVQITGLDVTTEEYDSSNGKPFTVERGPLDYYLLDTGNYSELNMMDGEVEKTFFVPVRFDKDLEAGYELCLQFGGNYYDDDEERRVSTTVFPDCDMRKTITSRLPLENGKIYCIEVTI